MATPDSGVPSARTWAMFTAGVAVASSMATVAGVLGWQRLHRQRMRHDLEDDVRRAMRKRGDDEKPTASQGSGGGEPQPQQQQLPQAQQVPRYLTALAAAQDGAAIPRASTPRNTTSIRPSTPGTGVSAASLASPIARTASATASPGVRPTLLPAMSSASRKFSLPAGEYDESLIREQLSRNYSFLGEEAMHTLRNSFVIVVGAGGVGSWCALMLLRSGVGRLRLIDFDQVSLSSLNRHACATLADVGRPKVQVCKERFAEIAPWCAVDARVEIFRGSDAPRLLASAKADAAHNMEAQAPTYVVDCIDNLDTKVDLLAYCYHHKIPCFSSMGAAAKADPSQIQVGDLNTTTEDPLARRVRRALRAKGVWGGGVMAKKSKKKGRRKDASNSKRTESNRKEEDDSKQQHHKEALQKLESGGDRSSATTTRKLEHSGRGADDALTSSLRPSSTTQTPSISRRASSNSSVGSAAFFSPLSSPVPDSDTELFGKEDVTVRGFRLPEAETQETEQNEDATTGATTSIHEQPVRPGLATLQEPGSSFSQQSRASRRTSSLNELAAEDIRSSLNGRPARSGSDLNLATHTEEDEGQESDAEEEQASEKPYTIMCVYSNEKSDVRMLPLDEEEIQKGNVDELAALEDFRVRILPVLGPMPAIFGLAAASYIICEVSGRTLEPLPFKGRRKTAERMWAELETSERRYPSPGSTMSRAEMALGPRRVPWTVEDVAYVFEEAFRCRSVVPPHETLTLGKLLRWDSTLPLSYSNVALFSKSQGLRHEEQVLKQGRSPVEVWGEEAARMFKRRMAEERRMAVLR